MNRFVGFAAIALALGGAACGDSASQSPTMPTAVTGALSEPTEVTAPEDATPIAMATVGPQAAPGLKTKEVEGLIESLPPIQPDNTLVVRGRTILTNASTVIRQEDVTKSFADLAVGMQVHVKGTQNGSEFLATRIAIQNTNGRPVTLKGTVQDLTGTADDFAFMLGLRAVHGDAATWFTGGGSPSFTSLTEGSRVEVKGEQRNGFVYATRIHIKKTK